jgi:hypothetical protein
MDAHDRELLDRQWRHVRPDNETSSVAGILLTVFLVGATFGGLVFAASEQPRVASNETGPVIAQAYNAAPFSRE